MNDDHSIPNPSDSLVSKSELMALKATAYHEAGHAVMAYLIGRPVEKVTISPAHLQTGGSRLGACKIQKGRTKSSKDELEDEVLILLAGMVGESHVTNRYCQEGASQDLRAVRRLLEKRATSERQLDKLARRMLDKTEHVLNDESNARAIQLIADALMNDETISGRAVKHLFEQAVRSVR